MEASQRHFHEESELVLLRQKSMLETLQFDNKMTQDKIDLFYPEVLKVYLFINFMITVNQFRYFSGKMSLTIVSDIISFY